MKAWNANRNRREGVTLGKYRLKLSLEAEYF